MSTRPVQLAMLLSSGTLQYRKKWGYDWKYAGGNIRWIRGSYYLHIDGMSYHLGSFTKAVNHLTDYITTGRPNHAMCRAGVK